MGNLGGGGESLRGSHSICQLFYGLEGDVCALSPAQLGASRVPNDYLSALCCSVYQPASSAHNELSMWNFSAASEIGICAAFWLGAFVCVGRGALERPLPSSGQLRTLTFNVSYQVEHNTALSCGVYN